MQDPFDHIVIYSGRVNESGENVPVLRIEKDNDEFRNFDTLEYVGTKLNMRYYADEAGKTHFASAIAEFDRNQ